MRFEVRDVVGLRVFVIGNALKTRAAQLNYSRWTPEEALVRLLHGDIVATARRKAAAGCFEADGSIVINSLDPPTQS